MGRRGRPPAGDNKQLAAALSKALLANFPPVTERDDEVVDCAECPSFHTTYRQFRIHNMQVHYNIATTADDTTVKDHKFYSRCLNELSKLTRVTYFVCPRSSCSARYKSVLGLAYHLETCGKSKKEVDACMVECDICLKKFTLPNLNYHKKSHHHPERSTESSPSSSTAVPLAPSRKRRSAVKACKFLEEMSGNFNSSKEPKNQQSSNKSQTPSTVSEVERVEQVDNELISDYIKREDDWVYEPPMDVFWEEDADSTNVISTAKLQSVLSTRPEIGVQALRYLMTVEDEHNIWGTPVRNLTDPFKSDVISRDNPLEDIQCDGIMRLYLPGMEQSIKFKTKSSLKSEFGKGTGSPFVSNYRRLAWFESEVVDSVDCNFIAFTGGPITSMAWHPSGNYLALATMKHYKETPGMMNIGRRRSSIQIYSQNSSTESTGSESSFVFSLGSFHLSLIVGCDYGYVNHLQWGHFWPRCCDSYFNENIEAVSEETNRIGYICCAFEDSTCRILALKKSDFELDLNFVYREGSKIRVYKKIPEIVLCLPEANKQPTGQCTRFDWHEGNRFLVAGYSSGLVAVFDLETKSKLLRANGNDEGTQFVIFYPFWVFHGHKWPVTGIHIDPGDSRYFHTASMDRHLRTWDIELRQQIESKKIGMIIDTCWIRGWMHVAASTDLAVSNLSAQYNFVRFYQVGSSQGRPNCLEYYNVTSLDFYEGMTAQASENGKVTVTYFDSFWRECDFERNKKKKNVVNVSSIDLDEESVIPLSGNWKEDIDKLKKSEKEPKVVLSFVKERRQGQMQMQPEPTQEYGENLFQYYHLVRINKVCWCPTGQFLAVGYRNGLMTIIPVTFDNLYNVYH